MSRHYTIRDLCMFTGLTDRTIRNYLSNGILQGEMMDRVWYFTQEQAEAFLRHPAVVPSIQAKRNAVVTDFMLDSYKKSEQMCVVWDLPGMHGIETSFFFTNLICNNPNLRNFNYSFEESEKGIRIILKGESKDILPLLIQFAEKHSEE